MVSGEIVVAFEVTRISDDVYAIVLRPPTLFMQEHIYREKKGKVYVGAKGSKQASSLVAGLVWCAVASAKVKEAKEAAASHGVVEFYCIVCRQIRTGSCKASMEIGGWACAHHQI